MYAMRASVVRGYKQGWMSDLCRATLYGEKIMKYFSNVINIKWLSVASIFAVYLFVTGIYLGTALHDAFHIH